jgi:hypothetical protein
MTIDHLRLLIIDLFIFIVKVCQPNYRNEKYRGYLVTANKHRSSHSVVRYKHSLGMASSKLAEPA